MTSRVNCHATLPCTCLVNDDGNGHRISTFTSRTADAFYTVCVSLDQLRLTTRKPLLVAPIAWTPRHIRPLHFFVVGCPRRAVGTVGYYVSAAVCELTLQISRDLRSPFTSSSNTATSRKCFIAPLVASTTGNPPTFLLKLYTSANHRGDDATALRFPASRCRTLSSPLPSVRAPPYPSHGQYRPTYHLPRLPSACYRPSSPSLSSPTLRDSIQQRCVHSGNEKTGAITVTDHGRVEIGSLMKHDWTLRTPTI